MSDSPIAKVALVGTGVIGRAWMKVFIRAGHPTAIFDKDPEQVSGALAWLDADLAADVRDGLIDEAAARRQRSLVIACDGITEALADSGYVQESSSERLAVKQAVFAEMDRAAAPDTVLASSTSALDINEITADLAGARRCMMAHPFNPPYVLPAVEVLPTRQTEPAVVERTLTFLRSVGMKPVLMNFHVPGFLANRIQAAVVREAIHLAESGVADIEAIDTVIREALGLRWALFGNFETNHTNADGGIREYYTRFGGSYRQMMTALDPAAPPFDAAMTERIAAGVDAMVKRASVAELCRWRDLMVQRINALKQQNPPPRGD
jgi:L-gulonate 3-dehydrogenase